MASATLTDAHKTAIRSTWSLVAQNLRANGIALFIKMFEVHPDYQKKFSAFSDVPLDQLATNKRLAAHASTVMHQLAALIDSLDDLECLVEMLTKIGERHLKHQLTVEHFQNLAIGIVSFLKSQLGAAFTADAEQGWTIMLQIVTGIVVKGMQAAA